jgi:hypothetical protein
MRKFLFSSLIALLFISAKAQDLSYYLPDSVSYDPAIPKPKEIIYHEVGEWHITHDRLVNYMKAIAQAAPNRVKMELMGLTYENRPQVLLIFSSKKNLDRLEEIRQQHVDLTNPEKSSSLNIEKMPLVIYIGHSIHGNEPSGANASLLNAYYLAAAQGKQIEDILDNTVILFDPSFNPDGLQRFSTWANQHKSKNLVTDPNSREFNEVWPGGRFNHYWFDLNRDWLPAVHVESQNRLKWFHLWKPNILTDHHEQGSNASFFFQPGEPARVNPITPLKNQELTSKLGKYHARNLDRIGSLYFTKENYDDFYYGKGSTYPDVNGAIGILFEQASSRGHAQETINGVLRFPFTIRNQFVTMLSTIEGGNALRKEFLEWQREFYKSAVTEAAAASLKGYVYNSEGDATKAALFTEMLLRHQIKVNVLNEDLSVGGNNFKKGKGYVVPLEQPQTRLIHGIFDKTLQYKDSLFYDITAWTLPLAFGLKYEELNAQQFKAGLQGNRVTQVVAVKGEVKGGVDSYAYLFEWNELLAPKMLYALQTAGVLTKVVTNPFEIATSEGTHKFDFGTILIPAKLQKLNAGDLYSMVKTEAEKNGVTVYGVQTGNVITGSDLGSSRMLPLTKPSVAMLVGKGVNATDAGEIWHLMDQRMDIPLTHLEQDQFNRVNLDRYNTILMVGGNYSDLNKEKLKSWVQDGGVLVMTEEAINWAAQNGISSVVLKKAKAALDSTARKSYNTKDLVEGAQQMSGAIFGAEMDPTHPMSYGYVTKTISLFKANKVFMEKPKNPYAMAMQYGSQPLQSGWASRENLDAVKNSAAVVVQTLGSGKLVHIADNPNFRAFWLGGTKLYMNALFFARLVTN